MAMEEGRMGLPSVLFGTLWSFRINRPQEGRRGGVDSSPFVPLETSRALGTCLAEEEGAYKEHGERVSDSNK